MKRYIKIAACLLCFNCFSMAQNFWQPINLFGGEITGMASNGSNVYAIRPDNIFMSSNNGSDWINISSNDFFTLLLAVNAAPNGYVYAGLDLGGIWWTNNNGSSWDFDPLHVSPQGQWSIVQTIGISPSNTVFASTAFDGHYRSDNNGQSWQEFDIQGLPIVEKVNEYTFKSSGTIFIATTAGVFRSTNGGVLWTQQINGMGVLITNTIVEDSLTGNLYAGTESNGIYFSSDNGENWVSRNNGLTGLNITSVKASASGKIFAAVYGVGIFSSTDEGSVWQQTSNSVDARVNVLTVSTGNVYAGTFTGAYVSTDQGALWSASNNGLRLNFVNSLVSKPGGELFVGAGNGLYYSSDNGISWIRRTDGLPEDFSVKSIAKKSNGDMYILSSTGGGAFLETKIFKSSNSGSNWIEIGSSIGNEKITRLLVSDNLIAAVALPEDISLRLFVTTDEGNNWVNKLEKDFILLTSSSVNSNEDLFVLYRDFFLQDTLIRSTDMGNTWIRLNSAVAPFNSAKFMGINQNTNNIYIIRNTEFRFSSDNGETWSSASVPWGINVSIQSMGFNQSGHVYVGTYNKGVFSTANNGSSWSENNSGLPFYFNGSETFYSMINCISFDSQGFAYACTFDDGVYKSTASTTGVLSNSGALPKEFKLYQNYPNPFNPVSNIKFQIPKSANVRLMIFNILGEEVSILLNRKLLPGTYEITWEAANFPSGVYFYRLEAGDYSEARKMILLK